MKVQGKFKMQAHLISGVVMDVAAFKVCHSFDTDATALRAARVRSKSIRGDGGNVWEGLKCKHSPSVMPKS